MSFDPPPNLERHIQPFDAIEGERIICIANDIKRSKRPHRKAGGRGQAAVIKKGLCWIERGFRIRSTEP